MTIRNESWVSFLARAALLSAASASAAVPGVALADVNISDKPTQNMVCDSGVCTPTAQKAILNVADLADMLASGDVTVNTGGIANDIKVSTALSWTSTSRLTLEAEGSLTVKKPVTVTGQGAMTLTTNGGGKKVDLQFSGKGSIRFWDLASSLVINGKSYALVRDVKTLAAAIAQNNEGLYALARNYNAQKDGTYTQSPIKMLRGRGVVEGLGNAISNLSIDAGSNAIGLFSVNAGTLRDLAVTDATVTSGGDHRNVAGILAGKNEGQIVNCSSSGAAVAEKSEFDVAYAGGLVGANNGVIIHSSSTATVIGANQAGGLVGWNNPDYIKGSSGAILTSYATGSVTAGAAGGLAGLNNGTIPLQRSAHQGAAGGLAGLNNGAIDQSFATGPVHGDSEAGGLVASTSGSLGRGEVTNAYATGAVTGAQVGGLAGRVTSPISTSYSTGHVSGNTVGGLEGVDEVQETDGSYWDLETSGISDPDQGAGSPRNDPGITGLTSAQLKSGLPAGFDPKIWAIDPNINDGYPYLRAIPPK